MGLILYSIFNSRVQRIYFKDCNSGQYFCNFQGLYQWTNLEVKSPIKDTRHSKQVNLDSKCLLVFIYKMPCGIEVAPPKTISGYYNIYLRLHLLLEHRWSGAMLKRNIQNFFFDPWSCISGIAIKNAARIRFIQVRYSVKTPGNRIEQSCFKMWNATCFRSEQPDRVQGVVQRNNTDCHKKVLIVQICLINRVSKIH